MGCSAQQHRVKTGIFGSSLRSGQISRKSRVSRKRKVGSGVNLMTLWVMVLVITIVSFIWAGTSVYIAIEVPQHNAANQSPAVRRAVTSLFLLCSVTKPDWVSKMIQDNVQDPIPAGTFPLSFGWMKENRSSPHHLDVMVNCLFDKVARHGRQLTR